MDFPVTEILNFIKENIYWLIRNFIAAGCLIQAEKFLQAATIVERMVNGYVADVFGVDSCINQTLDSMLNDDRLPDPPWPHE